MPIDDARVENHYGSGGLLEKIMEGLGLAGKRIDSLDEKDLIAVDAFHIRGRKATLELAELAQLKTGDRVLDVGCGLGGTARCLAGRFDCRVAGIDLTQEYIAVATTLTQWVGLEERVSFRQGSALDLPYGDGEFDFVWTEHVQMNIADKARFYAEQARVLKPGGLLLFHDIFRGTGEAPVYPTPWAEDETISALVDEAEARRVLADAGLEPEVWVGKNPESVEFFERSLGRLEEKGPPPLGIHLLMGDEAVTKLRNLLRNLKEDRVSAVLGLARRS